MIFGAFYKSKPLSYNTEISFLGIYPRKINTYMFTKRFMTVFHSNFIHNSQNMETTQPSIKKWIKKLCYLHAIEYYSVIKRNYKYTYHR